MPHNFILNSSIYFLNLISDRLSQPGQVLVIFTPTNLLTPSFRYSSILNISIILTFTFIISLPCSLSLLHVINLSVLSTYTFFTNTAPYFPYLYKTKLSIFTYFHFHPVPVIPYNKSPNFTYFTFITSIAPIFNILI